MRRGCRDDWQSRNSDTLTGWLSRVAIAWQSREYHGSPLPLAWPALPGPYCQRATSSRFIFAAIPHGEQFVANDVFVYDRHPTASGAPKRFPTASFQTSTCASSILEVSDQRAASQRTPRVPTVLCLSGRVQVRYGQEHLRARVAEVPACSRAGCGCRRSLGTCCGDVSQASG